MFADVLLSLILISIWFGFYQIIKQHGRIMLRLEALEQRLAPSDIQPSESLPAKTPFPEFTFRDLDERPVSLSDFRRKRVLVLHWNPECGFCDLLAPDLAQLQREIEKRGVHLLLLAYGTAAANRKLIQDHALECPVLLYGDTKLPDPFANLGTPSAYLLDGEGRVAKPLAVGSDEVGALVQQIANEVLQQGPEPEPEALNKQVATEQSLSTSRIVRNGLKAGTVAPQFTLPDLDGRMISLNHYLSQHVLLIFSDPNCGPCDELAPELVRFHKDYSNQVQLIMVGRGDAEENRKKAEQHGIEFPVVIQHKWRLSKEYGIFSTPVAFLINEEGVIAKDVAIGRDAILALAREVIRVQKEPEYELSYR